MSYKDFIRSAVSTTAEESTDDIYVEDKPVNDWEIDTTQEVIKPDYNDSKKNYNISLRDVIAGINKSKYKLSGNNVWLPDKNGNLVALPDWVNSKPGQGNSAKQYRVEMISTQGNIIKDKQFNTILKAVLYEDNEDVTAIKDKKYFKWARFSGNTEKDQIADAKWNLKWANGAKEIPITHEDVNRNAMFQVQFVTEKEAELWVKEAYNAYMAKLKNN